MCLEDPRPAFFFPSLAPQRFALLMLALPSHSGRFVVVFGPGRHLDRPTKSRDLLTNTPKQGFLSNDCD